MDAKITGASERNAPPTLCSWKLIALASCGLYMQHFRTVYAGLQDLLPIIPVSANVVARGSQDAQVP